MKLKFYFLFVGIFLFSFHLHAQCTDVTLSSQSDVDSFPTASGGCTILSGRLVISGNDITNLDGLSALTSIGGLTVTNNPNLANIDGLSSLTTVSGPDARIEFNGNLALTDIDGLSALTTFVSTGTGGWVSFSSNPALKNLDGLFFLHEIRGETSAKLDITFNESLENIDGLASLQRIVNNSTSNRPSVSVLGNHALTKGCGLFTLLAGPNGPQQCESSAEPDDYYRCIDININNNGAGVTVDEILAGGRCTLTGCNGDISLTSQADVDTYPQTYGCSIIKGELEIIGITNNITNLDSLYQVVEVKQLQIAGNYHLESLAGLSSLQTIHEFLSLSDNKILRSLHGLENLATVKDVSIRLHKLDDLAGLSGVTAIPGLFELRYNFLASVDGMDNLTSVHNLAITNDSTLTSLEPFSSLTNLGDIYLQNNIALTAVDFPALQTASTMFITGNPVLNNINFPSLQSAGWLSVKNNPALTSVGNFSELHDLAKLEISSNINLTNIEGLSQVTTSPMGVIVTGNPKLASLRGLGGLTTMEGILQIDDNDALTTTAGVAVTRIGSLFINGNANLERLEGLELLESAAGGGCECAIMGSVIGNNPKLVNLNGLSALTTVGGMLRIKSNASLVNIDGLSNLTSVGYNNGFGDESIDISDNPVLVSIAGLSKLTSLPGGLNIVNNDILTNLDGLKITSIGGRGLKITGNAQLSDINGLKLVTGIYGGFGISDNAVLRNLDGLRSLQSVSGAQTSSIGITNNPMLENVDSLTNLINWSTPMKWLSVVNNPNLTKGCGLYPLLNRYSNCSDCTSAEITFTGNGTTQQEIMAEGPCDGSGRVCSNVTLSSQAEVDAFATTGCPVVNNMLRIEGSDITNLHGLSMVNLVGFLFINGNDSLVDLSGLDSLKTIGTGGCQGCPYNGLAITNNPNLANIDALSSLKSVGGTVRISNNERLTNIDGLSSLTSAGSNDAFNDGSINMNTNVKLTNIEGLRNLTHIKGGVSIVGNPSLKSLEGLNKLTEIPKGGLGIYDNDSLVDISALSHVTLIWQYFQIAENDRLPNLNGLQSLKQVSIGGPNSYIRITNNAALTDVDSLSSLTDVPAPTLELTVTGNTSLTRACGLYPVLVTAFDCVICRATVTISDNGTGVTEESIRAGGACDGVDVELPSQPTNLVFSDVTSTSMRLSFTPSPADDMMYVVLMRTGQSPYPDDAPKDGDFWYPGGTIGNSEVVASGTDTTYVVSGLQQNTTYYFAIYAHRDLNYVDDEPLQGNQKTSAGEIDPGTLAFSEVTDNSMNVTFHPDAARAGYITIMRAFESALPDEAPEDGTSYSIGNVIGCCSIVVGLGMDSTLSVIYLEPDIDYYFDVIPYAVNSGSYSYEITAAISGHQRTLPRVQPYPNPFVEEVMIPFTVNDEESDVRIMIMDQMGRAVSEVVNDRFAKGKHEVRWLRTDMQGNRAVDGVYMYSIVTNNNEPVKGLFVAK